jgi:hypothetical protein
MKLRSRLLIIPNPLANGYAAEDELCQAFSCLGQDNAFDKGAMGD